MPLGLTMTYPVGPADLQFKCYAQALEADPKHAYALCNLGFADRGTITWRADPKHADPWFNLGDEDGETVATQHIEFCLKKVLETHFSTDEIEHTLNRMCIRTIFVSRQWLACAEHCGLVGLHSIPQNQACSSSMQAQAISSIANLRFAVVNLCRGGAEDRALGHGSNLRRGDIQAISLVPC